MKWFALISWVLTASLGFVMLTIWIRRGGIGQRLSGPYIRPPFIFGHFGLAALGLVLWIVYLITDTDALKWIALVIVLAVAVLGWTMFAFWYQRRRGVTTATSGPGAMRASFGGGDGVAAEQHFPIPVITLHGVLAILTVLLVLLTAVGIGPGT